MPDYPQNAVPVGHTEPVPRRVRALLDGRVALDTTKALYVWEIPPYPQFYIPAGDVDAGVLREAVRAETAREHTDGAIAGHVRFAWDAFDAWFEEDEQIFVHPKSPYARVDALRSNRSVRIEMNGVELASSRSPVMLFETGLPTRYYLDRTDVRWEHLVPSDTRTACPYKGRTTGYWSVRMGDVVRPDRAWCYDFPTREMLPIAGLIAFYNEKVDIVLDGELLERPRTPFSD